MTIKILTTCGCVCGANLTMLGDNKPLRGIHGQYTTHGGKLTFYAKVECLTAKCGLVYEPDHPRFSASFNEIAERLSEL